jgi:hypothetical protein
MQAGQAPPRWSQRTESVVGPPLERMNSSVFPDLTSNVEGNQSATQKCQTTSHAEVQLFKFVRRRGEVQLDFRKRSETRSLPRDPPMVL